MPPFSSCLFAAIPSAEIAWQPIVAYLLIALAAAWVLRRTWRTYQRATRGGGGPGEPAGGCGGCSQNTSTVARANAKPLVQLNPKPHDEDATLR